MNAIQKADFSQQKKFPNTHQNPFSKTKQNPFPITPEDAKYFTPVDARYYLAKELAVDPFFLSEDDCALLFDSNSTVGARIDAFLRLKKSVPRCERGKLDCQMISSDDHTFAKFFISGNLITTASSQQQNKDEKVGYSQALEKHQQLLRIQQQIGEEAAELLKQEKSRYNNQERIDEIESLQEQIRGLSQMFEPVDLELNDEQRIMKLESMYIKKEELPPSNRTLQGDNAKQIPNDKDDGCVIS